MKATKFITKGTGVIEEYAFRPIIAVLVTLIGNSMHPNFITFISLLYSISAAVLIIKGHVVLGVVLYFFFPILDLIDGALARMYDKKTRFGAFFDGYVDTISEIMILLALGFYYNQIPTFFVLTWFILLAKYSSSRKNWIYEVKDRQMNFFDYLKRPLMFTLIMITRNDTRKLLLVIMVLLGDWRFIIGYFGTLYTLALLNTIRKLLK